MLRVARMDNFDAGGSKYISSALRSRTHSDLVAHSCDAPNTASDGFGFVAL
jgi:hypothetical protein